MNFDINFELLKIFYVVSKCKNITKASEQLLVSQSAVSKAIKNIENQLECKLFIRSKKGVELTKEGEVLFHSAEKIINILNNDLNKIRKTKTINILVGKVIADKILVPYLSMFRKKFPNVHINLSSTDIDGVLYKIKNSEADFALGYFIDNLDESYEQRKIQKELHSIFVCNNSYHEIINRTVDIYELEKYPFIISAKGATTYKYALDLFHKYKLNINPSMEVLGTSLIAQFVKSGLGISIMTEEFISDEINNHELYKINVNKNIPTRYLNVLTYKNRKLNKEISYLIKLLLNENL